MCIPQNSYPKFTFLFFYSEDAKMLLVRMIASGNSFQLSNLSFNLKKSDTIRKKAFYKKIWTKLPEDFFFFYRCQSLCYFVSTSMCLNSNQILIGGKVDTKLPSLRGKKKKKKRNCSPHQRIY